MGIFTDAQGQLTPQSVVGSGQIFNFIFKAVLGTCKNEEDPIKNEGARVLTTLYIHFSDAQGQLTLLQSVMGSGQNSNSSKLLWLSSSPARIKKIQSKMKALEC